MELIKGLIFCYHKDMKPTKQKKKRVRMNIRQDLVAVENKIDVVLDTVNEIKGEMDDVKNEMRIVRKETSELSSKTQGLKTEMSEMKHEVGELKVEMSEMKHEVGELKVEMHTQTELISKLPTREELASLLNMKQQLDRVREIIRERLKVEV
mgnify:CR=1 FL=1